MSHVAKKVTKASKTSKSAKSVKTHKDNKILALAAVFAVIGGVFLAFNVSNVVRAEASTVVVNATNTQAWFTAGTTTGGTVAFTGDAAAPFGGGALQLKTDATAEAKAQYLKTTTLPLANLNALSYYTKQVAGGTNAAPTFQIEVKLHGIADGLTTLVYEPYHNGEVKAGEWQKWDLMTGKFWSTTSVPPVVVEGNGGDPFYTLDYLKGWYENAEIIAYGINVGASKPNYDVLVDGVTVNEVTFDFEGEAVAPMTKEACKNGGWRDYPELYKNQGQCVSTINRQ